MIALFDLPDLIGDGTDLTPPQMCVRAAIVFVVTLVLIRLSGHRSFGQHTPISRTALFWAAFILSRPLGATVGDLLDKPHANGGLALSRYVGSAVLAVFILGCIALLPQKAERLSA